MNYSEFVRSRFKTFGPSFEREGVINGLALTLHHATTGMVGELIELRQACSAQHLMEELGDFEFYYEAFVQNLPFEYHTNPDALGSAGYASALSVWLNQSGELLDLTKKLWIYNKPIDSVKDKIAYALDHLDRARPSMYAACGFDYGEVIAANIAKLEKRYPSGYSDKDAQARADKETGQ